MARPLKSGVDYFPLDVFMNDKVRKIEVEFGLTGFAILIKLYQKIYGDRGYYCKWDKEVALLFADDLRVGVSVVSEVLLAFFRRGIFDQSIYDKYGVLTSEGIQKRYLEIVKRRKECKIDERYALVDCALGEFNVNNNQVNACKNEVIASDNTQSKGNKNKEKHFSARGAAEKKSQSFDVEDFFNAALAASYKGGK